MPQAIAALRVRACLLPRQYYAYLPAAVRQGHVVDATFMRLSVRGSMRVFVVVFSSEKYARASPGRVVPRFCCARRRSRSISV